MRYEGKRLAKKLTTFIVLGSLLLGASPLWFGHASGAELVSRNVQISDSKPSATATYIIDFNIGSVGPTGSVMVEFCENTALFIENCDAPRGFDVSQAQLQPTDEGATATINLAKSNAHVLVFSQVPPGTTDSDLTYTVDNVVNPGYRGTFFARITTFPTYDASGPFDDRSSAALATNTAYTVSAEVPPFMTFCVGVKVLDNQCLATQGSYIDLGILSPQRPAYGQTEMLAATNAETGYSISVSGNSLSSGPNVLQALSAPTVSAPGVTQFGINLKANSNPAAGAEPSGPGQGAPMSRYNIPNMFTYQSGEVIASSNFADDYRRYTTTYLVNIGNNTPPGIYNSTFTYVAVGRF